MKKTTLTVGIAAYNEERNIGHLLNSILKQRQEIFNLEQIIVACDGCTDNTVIIVQKYAKKYSFIKLLNETERIGKSLALNKIYTLASSDFLLTFDADVLLERNIEIELMIKEILSRSQVDLVGGKFIPVKQKTIMGNFGVISYLSFEDAFLRLHNGNNIFALVGLASLIRKGLYKKFLYPKGTISDQNYLYVMATKDNRHGFTLARKTHIYLRTVSTFNDWRILGARSVIADKENIAYFFGNEILEKYSMPKKIYFISLVKWFFKSPFYSLGSLAMNIFIRLFPYKKNIVKNGMWKLAVSSKEAIEL